jgi:hypothetical protein
MHIYIHHMCYTGWVAWKARIPQTAHAHMTRDLWHHAWSPHGGHIFLFYFWVRSKLLVGVDNTKCLPLVLVIYRVPNVLLYYRIPILLIASHSSSTPAVPQSVSLRKILDTIVMWEMSILPLINNCYCDWKSCPLHEGLDGLAHVEEREGEHGGQRCQQEMAFKGLSIQIVKTASV